MNIAHLGKFASATILASIVSLSASAEVYNTDWLSEGDNLVVTDSDSGLEFLNLSETFGMSKNEVNALLGTTYSGWSFATTNDVESLFANFFGGYDEGLDTRFSTSTVNGAGGKDFSSLFGAYTSPTGRLQSFGLVERESDNEMMLYGTLFYNRDDQYSVYHGYGYNPEYYESSSNKHRDYNYSESTQGLWLVRGGQTLDLTTGTPGDTSGSTSGDASLSDPSEGDVAAGGTGDITNVPAPLALSSLALLGFGFVRRNRLS